ncbi:IclR family transcriptional regulator [Nakamurella antarctica]|uniref:Glycerol operon regulatory protein n=1 Tax=Nakamurella antarctica TaxID=1902245 RepID=A0A3G8ZU26_9ACTN|nr:IclR family transcriptional regulator [Nakamurella antarctica]AZI57291.1 IclR family transcriptional regulator [Nakamurella antarctica]
MASTNDGASVQSVDRALTILQLLAADGELGVTEMAGILKVHKSTAFRLVATLENHGLVEQVSHNSRYRLGVGVLRLAGATRGRLDVVRESRYVTGDLANSIGETVNLVILANSETLYLDQVAGPSALQIHNWVGRRNPLHATANGQVLLAHQSLRARDELIDSILDNAGHFTALTSHTVLDPETLRSKLDTVAKRGYAVAIDELEEGLTAIAAPIRGGDGDVIASLSVSGPSFRLTADRIDATAALVVEAAGQISARMGFAVPRLGRRT